eukprot:UC4_evm1s659
MRDKYVQDCIAWENSLKIEKQRKLDFEYERRLNPHSKADFELLYSEVEKWRIEHTQKINQFSETEADRLAALAELSEEQRQMLATLDQYEIIASRRRADQTIEKKLDAMKAPKLWKSNQKTWK